MDKLNWELPEVCAIPIDSVSASIQEADVQDGSSESGLSSSSSPGG
ncbi:TPA: lasso peptide [Legionella pneumophila]|nr:lasso peptide [Legionella pneumophila]HAT8124151.1 lasso peptide [Legionella pneumophila]HAT8355680.1 lasso peptide [Legionella pneumophila]HAU1194905.1 lasso peptide [Legionella pneumophila]HAU1206539.1 lasso peptide [Legionella pneumophila]